MSTSTLLAPTIARVTLPNDAEAVDAFARALRLEPRFFGPSSVPKPRAGAITELTRLAGTSALGAFVNDSLVGMAGLCPQAGDAAAADLYVAVLAPWRRTGIARRLVGALHDGSVEHRYTSVRLSADSKNRAALGLGQVVGMKRADVGRGRVELRIDSRA